MSNIVFMFSKRLFICLLVLVNLFPSYARKRWIDVPATSDSIGWMGRRFMHGDDAYITYPGVSMKLNYVGDSVKVYLHQVDQHPNGNNCFYAIVDGRDTFKFQLDINRQEYLVATHNDKKTHQVEIVKLTESHVFPVKFGGFSYYAKRVKHSAPFEPRTRKIEFIGNSITCGYGVEDTTNKDGFTSVNENVMKTYAALTARYFDAQAHYIAASGYGIYRYVFGEDSLQTIPQVYNQSVLRTVHEKMDETGKSKLYYKPLFKGDSSTYATRWNYAQYQPDVIVVGLGTNDFNATANCGVPLDSARFVKTGLTFLLRLRAHYPKATIVCVVGPMLVDAYPQGEMAWTRCQRYVKEMVQVRNKKKNDKNVFYFAFQPQTAPYGEDWHPSYITHQKMAEQLCGFIEGLGLGW